MNLPSLGAILVAATLCAPAARAMGGQDCAPEDLAPIDAWLAKHRWNAGDTDPAQRVASACKASPQDPGVMIVATAYGSLDEYEKNLAVALVDTKRHALRAVFKGAIIEDAMLRVGQASLQIDTAPYTLAPGVRAFGIDLSSSLSGPRCADAFFGPNRSLFIRDGTTLRPVLRGLLLSTERHVAGPACSEDTEFETTRTTIAVGAQSSHGLADLVLTDRLDEKPQQHMRTVIRFDGKTYRTPGREPFPDTIEPEAPASR